MSNVSSGSPHFHWQFSFLAPPPPILRFLAFWHTHVQLVGWSTSLDTSPGTPEIGVLTSRSVWASESLFDPTTGAMRMAFSASVESSESPGEVGALTLSLSTESPSGQRFAFALGGSEVAGVLTGAGSFSIDVHNPDTTLQIIRATLTLVMDESPLNVNWPAKPSPGPNP